MKAKYYNFLNLCLLILLTILLYFRVIFYDYVWDDLILFVYNTSLSEQDYSWQLISRPVIEGSAYFRPFVFYTWFLEFNIFGQSARISHIINIIIFSLNAWLTYLLAIKFLKKYSSVLPTLVLVYYVLNPVLIESTVWISGRFDLFVTFFTLISLNLYFSKNVSKSIKNIAIPILFFLALLSKELAIIFPFLLFFLWAFKNKLIINDWKGYIIFSRENSLLIISIFIVLIIYFFLRYNSLGVIGSTTNNEVDYYYLINDLIPLQAFFFYLKNYLLPVFYVIPVHPINWDLTFLNKIKLCSIFISFIFCILYFIKKRKNELWLMFSVIFTVILTLYLIPFNNGSSIGNMRFMTLGLTFYSILFIKLYFDLFCYFLSRLGKRTAFISVGMIYILFLIVMVQNFNQSVKVWANEYSLWKTSYLVNPEYSINKYNYIKTLVDIGMFKEAKLILQKNNVNMSPDEQALYALVLVNLDDKEGILYYEGLVDSLPKYHEDFSSLKEINSLKVYAQTKLTTQNLSSVYSSYAMSILMFNNDRDKAKKYYIISNWYHNSDLATRSNHNDFIIDYIINNKESALSEFLSKTESNFNTGERLKTLNFINKYCSKYSDEKVCEKWKNDKLKI